MCIKMKWVKAFVEWWINGRFEAERAEREEITRRQEEITRRTDALYEYVQNSIEKGEKDA